MTAPNQVSPVPPADLPGTLGALRASGHHYRTVKQEIRDNLLARMRSGEERFPGIVGYEDTVLPEVERALLAGHDMVLLGERGQGKTRLIRSLGALLDEWTPVIPGSVLNEHPMHPLTPAARALVAERGDELPIGWLHRSMRYGEKLATPDTSVGDLIGDVDPIRLAQGRTLGDPETIHFGLVPRTNRGIFAVNELPDLAERIQVALLNVLEERDIQVRGYQLRLPLDLLLVASANPEDYTNRGRIITPLKDRFGAEIRTHYPVDLDLELALIRQEADLVAAVPEHVLEVLARFARAVRESPSVDPRSGVSARFAIAAAETVAAAALRRSGLLAAASGEAPVARVGDAVSVTSTLRGKVEFESGEEGREIEILAHLLRTATAETFRARLAGLDLSGFTALVAEGGEIETGELVSAAELLRQVGTVPGLAKALDRLGLGDAPTPEEAAAGVEFVLEGLHLTRRLGKDVTDSGRTVYGGRG
ncbi:MULTISPECIES: sigma 54-interacting transcriptional regulator [Micromonospora]|uniref:Magnesium chelatase n=1 Tax=Micromonospora solifontis TaxID=2487138 RepID=A0ABX9W976_9ACTN|nr:MULTISPECIES: sigma 54-interacting transcriptional regulator [Micromonospora]NES17096.1 magnesium chelatase [Micromonospora sp. PPF5-17B]NES39394.1 magnesium chelatase [Micromonospora solifontis]NES57102.1 magnesium chelatase [Micromonospora sp. PPF5-6]RNL89121.1 magnesium chelatase [Micromonospora solifontis]